MLWFKSDTEKCKYFEGAVEENIRYIYDSKCGCGWCKLLSQLQDGKEVADYFVKKFKGIAYEKKLLSDLANKHLDSAIANRKENETLEKIKNLEKENERLRHAGLIHFNGQSSLLDKIRELQEVSTHWQNMYKQRCPTDGYCQEENIKLNQEVRELKEKLSVAEEVRPCNNCISLGIRLQSAEREIHHINYKSYNDFKLSEDRYQKEIAELKEKLTEVNLSHHDNLVSQAAANKPSQWKADEWKRAAKRWKRYGEDCEKKYEALTEDLKNLNKYWEQRLEQEVKEKNVVGNTLFDLLKELAARFDKDIQTKQFLKLRLGDRVNVYPEDAPKFSGVIFNMLHNKIFVIADGDNSAHSDSPFLPSQCKRLVRKKKSKFKVGDRVMAYPTNNKKFRGTIENIGEENSEIHYSVLGCVQQGLFTSEYLKKLVRKRKPKFKIGDNIYHPGNGRGVVVKILANGRVGINTDCHGFVITKIGGSKKIGDKKRKFAVGDRVVHMTHGKGTVIEVDLGRILDMRVEFDNPWLSPRILWCESWGFKKLVKVKRCKLCHGRGHVEFFLKKFMFNQLNDFAQREFGCPVCKGKGKVKL